MWGPSETNDHLLRCHHPSRIQCRCTSTIKALQTTCRALAMKGSLCTVVSEWLDTGTLNQLSDGERNKDVHGHTIQDQASLSRSQFQHTITTLTTLKERYLPANSFLFQDDPEELLSATGY